ncbi:type I restriction-modification system specificity subunit, partial [Mobilicoccus pelagius]
MSVVDELRWTVPVRRLGALAERVQDVGHPEAEALSVYLGRGVVRRAEAVDNHNVLGADLAKYQLVQPGDLVFNRLRAWQGGFGASQYRGIVSPAYIVAHPRTGSDARYLNYVLQSKPYLAELTRLSKWMPPSQFDILWTDLRTVEVPAPPIEEQRRIADFLDDRVARIDQIIAAREGQLDLMAEQHLGILDREVRDAGPPRRLAGLLTQAGVGVVVNPSSYFRDDGVPFIHGYNVRDGYLDLSEYKRMSVEDSIRLSRSRLQRGDVLVVRAGFPGRAAVVPPELEGGNCASVLLLRCSAS